MEKFSCIYCSFSIFTDFLFLRFCLGIGGLVFWVFDLYDGRERGVVVFFGLGGMIGGLVLVLSLFVMYLFLSFVRVLYFVGVGCVCWMLIFCLLFGW